MKVLLIENDKTLARRIHRVLQKDGSKSSLETDVRYNGVDGFVTAVSLASERNLGLVIVDHKLPDIDGLPLARLLKADARTRSVPVLLVVDSPEDRVKGLELGVEDVLAKPFQPEEIALRAAKILRIDARPAVAQRASFAGIDLDLANHEVRLDDAEVHLTPLEFKLLHYFIEHPGRVATRDALLGRVWGYHEGVTSRTVDAHVKRLREKLDRAGDVIETVRGIGYRLKRKDAAGDFL